MPPETTMLFFTIVRYSTDHGVKDTRKFRKHVLDWLSNKGYMDRVYDTKRTQDEVISDYQKQGLKIDDRRIKLESGGLLVMDNTIEETKCVCQECGQLTAYTDAVTVTSKGWLCDACSRQWRKGNDVY